MKVIEKFIAVLPCTKEEYSEVFTNVAAQWSICVCLLHASSEDTCKSERTHVSIEIRN